MRMIDPVFLPKSKLHSLRHVEKYILIAVDILAMLFAFTAASLLAATIKFDSWSYPSNAPTDPFSFNTIRSYLVFVAAAVIAFEAKGSYAKRKPFSNEIRELLTVVICLALINAAAYSIAKFEFSRMHFLLNWFLVAPAMLCFRFFAKFLLIRSGGWVRPMVIIGWAENAFQTAMAFDDEPMMGYRLTAFLIPKGKSMPDMTFRDREGRDIAYIMLGDDPTETLRYLGNPHVVLALEQGGVEQYQELIQQLSRATRALQLVPAVRGLPLHGMEANHFFAHEVLILTVRNNLARRLPKLTKRLFDLTFASVALLVGLPILLWIAANVMRSGRPIFYGHQRIGQGGESFACYKFRTMAPNADKLLANLLASDPDARAEWERDFKLKNDPRITSIGHFLRRTSLDELPQLWNVLKGDMSLVGPRPVVDAELERYGNQVDYYLEAKPGITGLWQISGRNDVTYDTRVYLDAWYVKNWSLFSDIVILLRTVKVILKRDGAY